MNFNSFGSYHEHEPEPRSYAEQLEHYTGIVLEELELVDLTTAEAPKEGKHYSPETAWHSESQSLVVFPPLDEGEITPKDLAKMAIPVSEFIKRTQPDIVIGCDRGGRPYSLAVFSTWQRRNPGNRMPTLDGKIHFSRLSTSVNEEDIDGALNVILAKSATQANRVGKPINGNRPRLLFIDDWIVSGSTREYILAALDRLGMRNEVDVNFVVMAGKGADAAGTPKNMSVNWHDDVETIGIDYEDGAWPVAVRTDKAQDLRKEVYAEVRRLADGTQKRGEQTRNIAKTLLDNARLGL